MQLSLLFLSLKCVKNFLVTSFIAFSLLPEHKLFLSRDHVLPLLYAQQGLEKEPRHSKHPSHLRKEAVLETSALESPLRAGQH